MLPFALLSCYTLSLSLIPLCLSLSLSLSLNLSLSLWPFFQTECYSGTPGRHAPFHAGLAFTSLQRFFGNRKLVRHPGQTQVAVPFVP